MPGRDEASASIGLRRGRNGGSRPLPFSDYRLSDRWIASGEGRDSGALIGALEDMIGEFQATIAELDRRPGATLVDPSGCTA